LLDFYSRHLVVAGIGLAHRKISSPAGHFVPP